MGESPRPTEPNVSPDEPATLQPAGPEPAAAAAKAALRKRRRRILAWGSAGLALLLVVVVAGGYLLLKHFNTNIEQDNIAGMLGSRPVDSHPQAENILVLGSDSRNGLSRAFGSGLVTDQSDTMMIIHVPADRKWAEVMSIPRDSYVKIPACEMGNGQMSRPTQFKINQAFATGNLDGNHTNLGVACTVKTLEQDTGIFINHFIVVNFTGFQNMVSALGGVPECNPAPINDPKSGLVLTAGHHMLDPKQALAYVRARYTLGDGSDLERIGRQQAFMSSVISRARGEIMNPVAIYKFLDALTGSLTIDSQLGGITGLYNLGESLKGIPSNKIAFFTLPNYPRSEVDPSDTANVLWTQPEDNQIFASFRDDAPASSKLFATSPASPAGTASPTDSAGAGQPEGTAARVNGRGSARVSASPSTSPSSTAPTPSATTSPSPTPSAPSLNIPARTANQNICAG